MLGCHSPQELVRADKGRWGLISSGGMLGAECASNDSASVKRRAIHPFGPTGGWGRRFGQSARAGTNAPHSEIRIQGRRIVGLIRYDSAGVLKFRSYDDVYGQVYCGWAPVELSIPSSSEYVFFQADMCAVGDGRLDQVHEVCWFPKGKTTGQIVFSSFHKPSQPPLGSLWFYQKEQLGNVGYFDQDLFVALVKEAVELVSEKELEQILGDATDIVESLGGAVSGSTGTAIPPAVLNARRLLLVFRAQLGNSLGAPEFDLWLRRIEEVYRELLNASERVGEEDFVDFYRMLEFGVSIPLFLAI